MCWISHFRSDRQCLFSTDSYVVVLSTVCLNIELCLVTEEIKTVWIPTFLPRSEIFIENYFGIKISCFVHMFIDVTGSLSLQVCYFHPVNTACIVWKDFLVFGNFEEVWRYMNVGIVIHGSENLLKDKLHCYKKY